LKVKGSKVKVKRSLRLRVILSNLAFRPPARCGALSCYSAAGLTVDR